MSNTEMISVPRRVYDRLAADAAAWRELGQRLWGELPAVALLAESAHVRELISEWFEWDRRRHESEASHALSAALDWKSAAEAPTFAELQRRRAQPGPPADAAHARRGEYVGGPVDWATGQSLHRQQDGTA